MQTAALAAPGSTVPKGCYKCGQTGHWSRDCTAPQSQWIPRQAPPPGGWPQGRTPFTGGSGAAGGAMPTAGGENHPLNPIGDAQEGGVPQQTAAGARKEKRKRPKLTLELLQSSKGLPDVFTNFPGTFRRQFKGRGHEASDLRRLLEMYKRWQDRVFPHGDYDAFICAVERLSSTNALKSHMHELRMRMLKEVQDIAHPPHVHLDEEEAGRRAAGGGEGGAAVARGLGVGDELDDMVLELVPQPDEPELDDELMALLEEPDVPAGATAALGRGAAATGGAEDENDDELLELLEREDLDEEGHQAQQPLGGTDMLATLPEEDEDELLELLQEGEEDEEVALQSANAAAAAAEPASAAVELAAIGEDEQRALLALAADSCAGPSQSLNLLPGSTVTDVSNRGGGRVASAAHAVTAHGATTVEGMSKREKEELLALLEEEEVEGGGVELAPSEQQPAQPSPVFDSYPATAPEVCVAAEPAALHDNDAQTGAEVAAAPPWVDPTRSSLT